MLIDTHAHLTDERYGGAQDIIDNFAADGLERAVTVGYDLPSSRAGAALAAANAAVYFTAGFHPSETGKIEDGDYDELLRLAAHPKCVAIGEIGLDYFYDDTDKSTQIRRLNEQLDVVAQSGLPAVFHVRDAYGDFDKIIGQNLHKLKGGAVLHCFSGSKEFAADYVKKGFYVSFSGSITFKNAVRAPEIVPSIPRDRLLVETDCPYLTPVPFRGKLNYPAYVRYTAAKAAEFRGETLEYLAGYTTENAYRFYFKMRRDGETVESEKQRR